MSKGTIIGLIIAIIVIIAVVTGFAIYRNRDAENKSRATNSNIQEDAEVIAKEEESTTNDTEKNSQEIENTASDSKILVVYYSAQTHTKRVAERIAQNLNADTFEIVPVDAYSEVDLDWTDSNSRVSKEYKDESLRDIKIESTTVPNWDNYDTVIIGYPIWWGIAAWPTDTFVKANDFNGKTVIPFCTSYSSGVGRSDKLLEDEANGGDWKSGQRFYQDVDLSEVDKWINGLGL